MFSDRLSVLAEIRDYEDLGPAFLHVLIQNVNLQLSPVLRELGVLVVAQRLFGKHQDLKVEQGAMQIPDSVLIERFAKIDAA